MMRDAAPASALKIERVGFRYQKNIILQDVSLDLAAGEIIALLGPSGCGKTTLLKLVAGLLAPTDGRITIAGTCVADAARGIMGPPETRGIGMVFQDYALWPHMSVARNVSFPLEQLHVPRAACRARTMEALERVGLGGFAARRPGELSGGQQQRVALARAIVARPALVLFDEPLSNLDHDLRASLADDICDLMRSEGLSGLYVTHDQGEAFAIAQRIAIMRKGNIVQLDTPAGIVTRPATVDVSEFLSLGTIAPACRTESRWRLRDSGIDLCPADAGPSGKAEADVLLRHGSVQLSAASCGLSGRVLRSTFTGGGYRLKLAIGDAAAPIEVTVQSDADAMPGALVDVCIDSSFLSWF